MVNIYNSLQSAYEGAKKTLDDCIKAVGKYLESCEKEERKANDKLPQMRDELYRLNSIEENLQSEFDAAVDARSKLNKEMSPDEYNAADSNVDAAEKRLKKCQSAKRTVERCIRNLENAVSELEKQHRELEAQKGDLESAVSKLEKAWNSFSSGYDSAESELNRIKSSADRAYDAAHSVAETIAKLKGSGVGGGEQIKFVSITGVEECADKMKAASEQIFSQYGNAVRFNSYYAEQISDPAMDEMVQKIGEIGENFSEVAQKYRQVADRLNILAESLTDYIKCKL